MTHLMSSLNPLLVTLFVCLGDVVQDDNSFRNKHVLWVSLHHLLSLEVERVQELPFTSKDRPFSWTVNWSNTKRRDSMSVEKADYFWQILQEHFASKVAQFCSQTCNQKAYQRQNNSDKNNNGVNGLDFRSLKSWLSDSIRIFAFVSLNMNL